jgi:hypothetical protein
MNNKMLQLLLAGPTSSEAAESSIQTAANPGKPFQFWKFATIALLVLLALDLTRRLL